MRFATLFPPSRRGLRGANKGLGSAYSCFGERSNFSRCCGFALCGVVALRFWGNGGKAQSRLDVRSGDGGPSFRRGTGVVALRFMMKGDLGGVGDRKGDRLL